MKKDITKKKAKVAIVIWNQVDFNEKNNNSLIITK